MSLKKYMKARDAYFNGEDTGMTDAEFDALEDSLVKSGALDKNKLGTGAKAKKFQVELPILLPSLAKYKPELGEAKFERLAEHSQRANHYDLAENLVMDKLDGSSLYIEWDAKGRPSRLITRGDGQIGQDCTFLLKHLDIKAVRKGPMQARAEAVIPRAAWKKLKAGKFAEYGSARALASGLLNRQSDFEDLKQLHIVILRVFTIGGKPVTLDLGLDAAAGEGLRVVERKMVNVKKLGVKYLEGYLESRNEHSIYDMDGLVVHGLTQAMPTVKDVERKPKYGFAFKVDAIGDAPETTIVDIVWKISAFGQIIPKAIVEPIDFNGVTVKQCALHNASWAAEKGAGIGARVKIIRSGEIIPKIVAVVKAKPLTMPTDVKWKWDENHTNILTAEGDGIEQRKAVLTRFFSGMELDGLGPSAAAMCAESNVSPAEVLKLDTVAKWRKAINHYSIVMEKWAAEIKRVRSATDQQAMVLLMAKCGVFDKGLGERKLRKLVTSYNIVNVLKARPPKGAQVRLAELRDQAHETMGPAAAEILRKGLVDWWEFVYNTGIDFNWVKPSRAVAGPLSGMQFAWTGYRSEDEEERIKALGGTVGSFGAKTDVLFYKKDGKASSKVDKAGERAVVFAAYMKKIGE